MHPCSSKACSPAGTLLRCSPGREDLGAPGGRDLTGLRAAPMTCLHRPSLPKVIALQGWARDLPSSHPRKWTPSS